MGLTNARARGHAGMQIALALVLLLAAAASAMADTVIVTADNALVWNRPSGTSFVVTQLAKGTKLDVVGRTGDWYEVVLPAPVSGAQTGFIRANQLALDSRGPMSEAARRAATANAGSARIRMRLGFLNLDIASRTGGTNLVRTSNAFGDRYPENGTITANYGDGSGYQFDAIGSQAIWGRVGIGLGASYYQRKASTSVSASVPHPLISGQPRTVTFATTTPAGTELAIHLPIVWIPAAGVHIKILVFGGPSVFKVSQDVVDDVSLNDAPPYDAPSSTGVRTTREDSTNIGLHVGGDVGYFFSKSIGVGVGARYSRATLKFTGDPATIEGQAGTTEVVAGLRFRF